MSHRAAAALLGNTFHPQTLFVLSRSEAVGGPAAAESEQEAAFCFCFLQEVTNTGLSILS